MGELVLYPNNTMMVELAGVKNSVTGLYLQNATIQITAIVDNASAVGVTGANLPVTLQYVPRSRGVYRGRISANASFTPGHDYKLSITQTDAAGSAAYREIVVPARARDS